MLSPTVVLIPSLLLGQVVLQPPRAEGSRPNAHMLFGAYTERNSILGGRFILVDTLRANMESVVTPIADSDQHKYSYTLIHSANSTGRIDHVTIGPLSSRPMDISSPEHWEVETNGDADRVTLVWTPAELGPAPPDWVDDGANLYPSAYSVSPGDSLAGFGFTVPGVTDMFAGARIELEVWQPLRSVEEVWVPECPYRAIGRVAGPGARR